MMIPLPPWERTMTYDKKQDMHTWRACDPQNDWMIVCWDACLGLRRDKHRVPLFLARKLNLEELHMLNMGCH